MQTWSSSLSKLLKIGALREHFEVSVVDAVRLLRVVSAAADTMVASRRNEARRNVASDPLYITRRIRGHTATSANLSIVRRCETMMIHDTQHLSRLRRNDCLKVLVEQVQYGLPK